LLNPGAQCFHIFPAGFFIASVGAVMDIAMDIAASMNEVFEKKPGNGCGF